MKILFYKILSYLGINRQTDLQMLRNNLVHMRHEYETRIQSLEGDVHRMCVMLSHNQVDVTTDEKILKEHFETIVKDAIEKSYDFDRLVSDAIDDHDFTDTISDGMDDAISNRDWSDIIDDNTDYDKIADKVIETVDWSDVISDNDIITRDEVNPDDLMLKSEHMSDDDLVTRDNLSDMVSDQLKRDWFPMMVYEIVGESFDKKLLVTRENAQANCVNAIDDEIENAVSESVRERMKEKFGPEFDNWFNENIRHTIKIVLGEFLQAAYEQTKNTETNDNA